MDSYGATIAACLVQFLDVAADDATELVRGWRETNPEGSAWSPLGEDHVEPLAVACELAFAGLTDAELLRQEAEVWRAHRADYHRLKERLGVMEELPECFPGGSDEDSAADGTIDEAAA